MRVITFIPFITITIGLQVLDRLVVELTNLFNNFGITTGNDNESYTWPEQFTFDLWIFMNRAFEDAYWPEELTSEVSDES